jgi:ATP-dependent DNA helicase RecG
LNRQAEMSFPKIDREREKQTVSLADLASQSVGRLPRVGFTGQKRLEAMGIRTLKDLLQHYPRRYIDRSKVVPIARLPYGEEATCIGRVERVEVKKPRPRLSILVVTVRDATGTAECVWFNQEFRAQDFSPGQEVAFSGRIDRFRHRFQIQNPSYDVISSDDEDSGISDGSKAAAQLSRGRAGPSLEVGRIVPVYPASARSRISSGYLRRLVWDALRILPPLEDPLPPEIRAEMGLLDRYQAYRAIHFPDTLQQAERARKRLVVDEVLGLQLALRLMRNLAERDRTGISHPIDPPLLERFLAELPFELTADQRRALEEIAADMASSKPMHRLLQGEVGSGKTVVAAAATCIAVAGGHQAALMAPTEVLAGQHFYGLLPWLEPHGVRMDLLTSSLAGQERRRVLDSVATGQTDLLVGTHALFQEGVVFRDLGLVIVDEQHRFGVHQRLAMRQKARTGKNPDVLIMTATPIPRTAALTFYGDLDVSTIESLPAGRKPIATKVLGPQEESVAWSSVIEEARRGHQAFVVCPVIEESDKLEAAAAEAEFERLENSVLSELRLGLLHGRMAPSERQDVMERFRRGEIDVLVSTTIVEVGVDVPNATVIVVLSGERFGLAQLHQLRGRVGRGSAPGHCFLVASSAEAAGIERLKALEKTQSGIELAEIDLRLRGEGAVFGVRQTGRSDLKLTRLNEDALLIKRCREWAKQLLEEDPLLRAHPALRQELEASYGEELELASAS